MLMPDVTWNGLSYSRPIFWWTKLALLRVALALRKVNFVNRNIQALNKPTLPCCELCIQFCFNASAWAPGTSQSLVNSSCALPPPPGLPQGIYPPCQTRRWGIYKICAARGPGICQPRDFDTHAVSYQNMTTQRILLEKQADWAHL